MKKNFTFSLYVLATLLLVPSVAKAQTPSAPETYGDSWVDDISAQSLLGHHWKGRSIEEAMRLTGGEDLYLVNVKTGEYLDLGDYWGVRVIANEVGSPLTFEPAKSVWGFDGYLLKTEIDFGNQTTYIGRGSYNERITFNAFEYNRMLFANCDNYEYAQHPVYYQFRESLYPDCPAQISGQDNKNGMLSGKNGGAFIWMLYPAKADENGGYQYIIYTRRQTVQRPRNNYNAAQYDELKERVPYIDASFTPNNYPNINYNAGGGVILNQVTEEYGSRLSYYALHLATPEDDGTPKDYSIGRAKKFAGNFVVNSASYGDEWEMYKARGRQNIGEVNISLEDGLRALADDPENLWKIVTRSERKKYRVTASKKTPVDVSFNINNHKFYVGTTDDSWKWTDSESSSSIISHTHPYNASNMEEGSEFHKIGTGHYFRYGFGDEKHTGEVANESDFNYYNRQHEEVMTLGLDANYSASIHRGVATLKQKITGLRSGTYIVYCRAFHSPLSMQNFTSDAASNAAVTDKTTKGTTYLYAKGTGETVRRRLPSIFEAWMPEDKMSHLRPWKEIPFATGSEAEKDNPQMVVRMFQAGGPYSEDGQLKFRNDPDTYGKPKSERRAFLSDDSVFVKVDGSLIGRTSGKSYYLPKTINGAGRFFNAIKHEEANRYRIGVKVTVSDDGILEFGVSHNTNEENEWVCFDDFELVYLGQPEPNEFIIDEDNKFNNTIKSDLWEYEEANSDKKVKLVIHRTFKRNKWNSVILPVSLTKAQVESTFGKGTLVSILKELDGKVIRYEKVDPADNEVMIEAAKSYIIKPTDYPLISADSAYYRTKSEVHDRWVVVGDGRNAKIEELKGRIAGPVYILDDYVVNHSTFPRSVGSAKTALQTNAADEWAEEIPVESATAVRVYGAPETDPTYRITSFGYYDGFTIPANAYYHSNGDMYYTGTRTLATKGFRAYVRLVQQGVSGNAKVVFMDKFLNGDYLFVPVKDDISGITTVEDTAEDNTLQVFDLQGRRVSSPKSGLYIVNGKKMMFK
ncbi:MAG: hypothetical protein IJ605_01130 [Prevotella sp.]|nr:hypothetical protein [Prevotella sp.]